MATDQSLKVNNPGSVVHHNNNSSTSLPLFELVDVPSRLMLEKVYLNGLHALRRFEIRNISQQTILVKLRSNLGSQIAFQLSNENLPEFDYMKSNSTKIKEVKKMSSNASLSTTSEDYSNAPLNDIPEDPLINITTNTVAAAAAGAFGDNVNGYQFNQLFNYVNHIDEVEISPGCSQKIILAFLPDSRNNNTRRSELNHASTPSFTDVNGLSSVSVDTDEVEDIRGNTGMFAQSSEEDETHDFFEVNGLLFFFAYIIDKQHQQQNIQQNGGLVDTLNIERSYGNNIPSDKYRENYGSNLIRYSSAVTTKTIDLNNENDTGKSRLDVENVTSREIESIGNTSKADQQITIKFRSTVCRSVLWTDVGETGINFDDCVIGGTYFKDFTIWNRSEIELYWLINTVDLSYSEREGWLKFTDYDTGESLDNKPIPSYSHRRIRITFRSKEIGEFNYDLQLENANDPENVLQSRIHAVVRSVLREELLVISSGNVLDFGDCCAGVWSKQKLVLKNVSVIPLEINFAAENAEVLFHLSSENLKENGKYPKNFIEEIDDLSALQPRFRDLINANSSTTTTSNTPINTNSMSEISSRAVSPTPQIFQNLETDGLILPTENASFPNDPISENAFKTTIKHRSNIVEDSDIDGSLGGENLSGSGFLTNDSTEDSEIYFGNADNEMTQIDEVNLGPGKERIVQVSYRPEKDSSANNFKAGKLIRRNFRIIVQYGQANFSSTGLNSGDKERKIIQCKARSCTSFVEVNPKEVNFGDTDVGTHKSLPITITNLSELTAQVELKFISKVLCCTNDAIVIPPKMSTEVKLNVYPRKVNVDYRKQITVVNLQNRNNDQIIEVRSTNIDKNRVTFHSLFYRILTSTGRNFIDFGTAVLNSPSVRTFTIDNISAKNLILELSSSLPEEIVIYRKRPKDDNKTNPNDLENVSTVKNKNAASINMENDNRCKIERREKLLESIGDRSRMLKKHSNIDLVGTSTNKGNLSASNTLIPGDNKRHTVNIFSDSSLTDLASSGAAYLDLAGTSTIDSRRPPRRRPIKSQTNKPPGMNIVIDRIKESSITGTTISINSINSNITKKGLNNKMILDSTNNIDSFNHVEDKKGRENKSVLNYSPINFLKTNDSSTFADMSLESLITSLESNNSTSPPLFPNPAVEETYVRNQMGIFRELRNRIRDHQIVPAKIVEIPPSGECQIIVIFTPKQKLRSNVQGLPKKFDARVFIRLIDFDRDIQQPQFDALLHGDQSLIPVRELMVNSTLCRSIIDLGQKNINFGLMEKNERRKKTILIQNRSEVPLLYNIRKSGSIASGDIVFGIGRLGIVRGYGKKEIVFSFEPSLSGPFHERIEIENILDRENNQVLSVKANIKKQYNFFIQNLSLDFGVCLINEIAPKVQHITISNTNKQSRTIEVRFDPQDLKFNACIGELNFILQEESDGSSFNSGILSKEIEEEIEILEQKVKIARRKGRADKAKKIEKKLIKLRRGEIGRNGSEDETEPVGETALSLTSEMILKEEKVDVLSEELFTNGATFDRSVENVAGPSNSLFHTDKSSESSMKRSSYSKYKKTSSSIIFTLESRTTKTVSVSFKPVATESSDPKPTTELIAGRVYIHEHKNKDIVKTVVFKASVCYDHFTFLQALTEESSSADYQSESSIASPAPEFSSFTSDMTDQHGSSSQFMFRKFISSQGYDITLSPETELFQYGFTSLDTQTLSPENLILEPVVLDFSRLEVNQSHNYYFKLTNQDDIPINYEIIIPDNESSFFQTIPPPGTLLPQVTQKIDFTVISNKIGYQSHSLIIKNCETKGELKFMLHGYVHYSQYLRFPSLGDDGQSILNLGYCYVDPGRKYSQVTPLLVENISDEDVYITCQSNLSLQVSVFLDENGEKGQVVGTLLKKKSMMSVWVALQPNLFTSVPAPSRRNTGNTSNSVGNGISNASIVDRNAIANGECRELIGGIKFSVQDKEFQRPLITEINDETTDRVDKKDEEMITIITQTVKFTSLIGRSILSVSDKIINLGSTSIIGETFYGSFTIFNMSNRLPLDYVIECHSGNIILDRTRGTLEGWDSSHESGKSSRRNSSATQGDELIYEDLSSAVINFRVTPSKFGFFRDKIVVTNKNNADQIVEVEIRLFVNKGILDLSLPDEKLPLISWDNIAGYQDANIPLYEQCLEIRNNSEIDVLHLVPRSDLNVKIRWGPFGDARIIESSQDMEIDGENSPFKVCGPLLELKPNNKAHLYISCPQPNSLAQKELERMSSGRKVDIQGLFLLMAQNLVVKLVDLKAKFCVPIGELNKPFLNVGRIGHSNSWAGVKFQFSLRNISDIPLHYELQSPDCIEISGVVNDGSSEINQGIVALKRTLEPQVDQIVTAVLKPRRIDNFNVGERIFNVNILNMFNPLNTLTLEVKAMLTLFELKFDRLIQGELVLPTLHHPTPLSNLPCDAWFTILNSRDHDIRFEIGVELAPDVSKFIKVEVLSRFSNSPLVGGVSVSGHGSIEVRVRAYPIENIRIPRESSYLTNNDGVTFGKLWVATKQNINEDDKVVQKVAENIPIRGFITESPTFSVSPKRILFKTAWTSSDLETINNDNIGDINEDSLLFRKNLSKLEENLNNLKELKDWPAQKDNITIVNLSDRIPLSFKVQIEGPMELSGRDIIHVQPLDKNGCGIVEPGQKLTLEIILVYLTVAVSEDIKVHIVDLQSLSGQKKSVNISIESDSREIRTNAKNLLRVDETSDTSSDVSEFAPLLDRPIEPSTELPYITLRGCKRIWEVTDIGGRYELDLGQQDLGSPTIVKKLTLENSSNQQIPYRLKTVSVSDKNWLNLSRTEGILESTPDEHNRQYNDSHTITLSFSTITRNIYSTYLIVENLRNPSDTKTIRILMEIVARQNLRRGANTPFSNNHVFDIYVNGVDSSQTLIEMFNLFYGSEYSARSMVIYNRETVPLEFKFQTNLDYNDPTEIVFSTSRMSAKLFKTLTVDPETNVRVYIRFRPMPSREIQEFLDKGNTRDPNLVEEKIVEIYVNCRLVKDYQQTLKLKAECRMPSIQVDYKESDALMEDEDWIIHFDEKYRKIIIKNSLPNPLKYEIVNDTMYFNLEFPKEGKEIGSKLCHEIIVRPNIKALIKNAENVRREKYIQEQVTVYNRNRPSENYWIPLRISFGYCSNFQLASGYKTSYAFSILENHAVRFLSEFNRSIRLFSLLETNKDEEVNKKMADLEFQYFFIVDQLVYYATIKSGENWFQLASLLFGTVLNHQIFKKFGPAYLKNPKFGSDQEVKIWPSILSKWVSPLNYFISFFPYKNQNPMLETLKELHKSLVITSYLSPI
ncbi:8569_t:CDS:10 [Diversispora eburnea]|uniref:8569_t:CDS:1 n=1 Tax=Diversispora eburnea TaxID=1213867 RepID=A0A9N8V996_9GLOM|nr:8569_t:CDS:10 [Diversispora eburnea]